MEAEGSEDGSEAVAGGAGAAPLGALPPSRPGAGVYDRLHYGDSQQSQLDQACEHEGPMVGDLFGECDMAPA